MKEADVRRAIGLDTTLTTAQKYTLIMLLTRLDWETWTGQVSAHDLATISTQADRQVKRHIAALKRAGWIDRLSNRRPDTPRLNHKADTILNTALVAEILKGSVKKDTSGESDTSGKKDTSGKLAPQTINVTSGEKDTSGESDTGVVAKTTLEGCQERHRGSGENDTGVVAKTPPNINIDQYDDQPSHQPAEPQVEPNPAREGALEAERREALQAGCRLIAPTEDMGSLFAYRVKIDEVARFKGRADIRLALAEHDAILAQQAHKLRISPASIVTYVEPPPHTQRAPQSLIRR